MIYVISPKDIYAAKRLIREARIRNYVRQRRPPARPAGIRLWRKLRIINLQDLIACGFRIQARKGDVLYVRNPYFKGRPDYLSRIINLAKRFKAKGGRVVDANIVKGDLGRGKWVDYQKLKKAGLPIPRTKLPESYPLILKWIYGFKGRGTFLIKSEKDLAKIPLSIPKKELMAQAYIEAKYEYKVIAVGFKVLPVILRFKFNKRTGRVDFKNYAVKKILLSEPVEDQNFFNQGFEPLTPVVQPINRQTTGQASSGIKTVVRLAERASKVLGRELAKVDILEAKGKFYILEVNRLPGLKSFEELTKYNVFKEFIEYLQKHRNLV